MRIAAACFTKKGQEILLLLSSALKKTQHTFCTVSFGSYPEAQGIARGQGGAKEWTAGAFADADALVFVGAAGIAVRLIAPFVKDKKTDPAVLVIDEEGTYVIPLLSGHYGGANALAEELSALLEAQAVITTATDREGLFAVDVFAKKNGLNILEWDKAKQISADLLQGKQIGFFSEIPCEGLCPQELALCDADSAERFSEGIYVSRNTQTEPFSDTLHLYPQDIVVGIGCRQGVSEEALEEFLIRCCAESGISLCCLKELVSADRKKEEKGLRQLGDSLGIPFRTFSAQELEEVPGDFSDSDFVRQTVGTGCVCERAAVLASGGGELLRKKTAEQGMTIAFAGEAGRLSF